MRLSFLPLFILLCLAQRIIAQEAAIIPGNLLVQLHEGGTPERLVEDLQVVEGKTTGLRVLRAVSAPMRIWALHHDGENMDQRKMLRLLQLHPSVRIAQNDHIVSDRNVPDDTQYTDQWHHANIDSEAAWAISTGGVTALGDTIVLCNVERSDPTIPDLLANAWYNHNEIPGNGQDDDGNGYVDDYRGWNIDGQNDDVYGGGHGTQVIGMMAAVGNNSYGVVGANWKAKVMVVRRNGIGESDVVEAYTYPWAMRKLYNETNGERGAFVVVTNASWGIDFGDPEDSPLWCAVYDSLGTAGILSCGATANQSINVDVQGDLPTACPSDFLISVTATNEQDVRTFSAFGATTIDVGAPGDQVVTTNLNGSFGSTSGTSFASPLTAGVVGLLYSAPCEALAQLVQDDPEQGALYVREALFIGTEPQSNLQGETVTGGRISSGNSLQWIMDNCGVCAHPFSLQHTPAGGDTVQLSWNAPGVSLFNVRYREVGTLQWTETQTTSANTTLGGLAACTTYEAQAESVCDGVPQGFGAIHTWTTLGCGQCLDFVYCQSKGDNSTEEWIAQVALNGAVNTSDSDSGYGDYTGAPIDLLLGSTYSVSVTPGLGPDASAIKCRVFIDFDQNGVLSGAGETVLTQNTDFANTVSSTFTVPANAPIGTTRMRVVLIGGQNINSPCQNGYNRGETEDYCVNILTTTTAAEAEAVPTHPMIFPVPTNEVLSVLGAHDMLWVTNSTGQTVLREVATPGTTILSVGQLPNGYYAVHWASPNGARNTARFVVLR
jgi:Subtilase family/GEVED domain